MNGFDSKAFLATLTSRPGVYQMYDADGRILYVGKAKNLKNRLSSYFRNTGLSNKTVALVGKIRDIQVTVVATERDALLLEHNLIKAHKPPYNILLKDDKSYLYVYLSSEDKYPRLALHRGAKRKKGRYFGPYPSANAVRESLHFLQKVFQVRQCEDSYFRNRSRPCLQHQIGRCTAPCVELVSEAEYREQVDNTVLFLSGKSQQLMRQLADEMEAAAKALQYEKAAKRRDQIAFLQEVQAVQGIEGSSGDLDILAIASGAGKACIHVLFVRGARVVGSRSYYPPLRLDETTPVVLSAFLTQFYLNAERQIPRELLVSHIPEDREALESIFSERSNRKVAIRARVRKERARWLALARQTAGSNLEAHLQGTKNQLARLEQLAGVLGLDALPERIECFDISHSSGEATVASCVVFGKEGPKKSDYRRFNIESVAAGDDYGAMYEALTRRYRRVQSGEGVLPNVLLIDGGKGQVAQAMEVLSELGISGVEVVGVAKGSTRKAGFETLINAANGQHY
ncbi:MAG: excinuclease ABC subunit C, partial [Gammaproteobacteria bacterium]